MAASPMEIRIDTLTLTPDEQRAKDGFNGRQSADLLHLKTSPFPTSSPIDPRKANYNLDADMDPEERERRESDSKDDNIVLSGYLDKKKDSGGDWKKRWMVLYKGGPIYYYESAKDEEPSGVIYLVNATLFEKIQLNGFVNEASFGVRIDKKDFLLKAKTAEQKVQWCTAIDENMSTEVVKEKSVSTKSSKKKSQVSGSFYKNGEELDAEELEQQHNYEEDDDEESSDSEDDESGSEDEEEDEEHIDDEEVILDEGVELLKDSKRNLWTKRHAIVDHNGEMFIYREASTYPTELIKLKEASIYSRVEHHGKEINGAFNIQFGGKNYIFRPTGEMSKKEWLERIKSFNVQDSKKHAPHLADLAHLKDQGKKMSFFEVEDSLSHE
eukprot:TRINITY_DN690_c0_g1_i1.p1 TRINITY_DN690_c0_g1~~TRINITY_DN690_c0_g1_i1.p1  ORF type:complete len:383 (-),score=159.61 TRINITY_DN690_c0_g1_i1:42-1190(-)